MSRTYPLGYRLSVTIERGPQGPSARVLLRETREDPHHSFAGLVSYEALSSLEVLAFTLLEELTALPDEQDPF